MISQAVEHEGDQFSGGGDGPDVAATTLTDPVSTTAKPGVRGHALHGLDRGPADQAGALLGDPAAVHDIVGLVVRGVSPAQEASC